MILNLKYSSTNVLIIFILIITTNAHLLAQNKASEIDNLVQTYYEYGQFNGSVLVAEAGKVILKKGYGYANMEWNILNEADTKFDIGSITKQFTAMLVMQLVEESKIQLDAKISRYLPDYRKDIGEKVTIHQLLTNTSGIPDYSSMPNFFKDVYQNKYTIDAFIKKFCSDDLAFKPGTDFLYSNSGYYLLGAIIEKVTNESYESVLHKKILDPLGMKNTGYDQHDKIIPKLAAGYENTLSGYKNSSFFDMSNAYSAGAMYSTVEDLYLWDQALYGDRLLTDKYKAMMFTPYLNNYGYGWYIKKIHLGNANDSTRIVDHGGLGVNGIHTLITRFIDDKHLIVLLHNTGGTSLKLLNRGITNILYDQPYQLPKKSIACELFQILNEKDISTGINQYHSLKTNYKDGYYFYWDELDWLGRELIELNRTDDAIAILKLNVDEYPEYWFVYDTLAEAYLKNNKNKLAIENYRKLLQLNPNNTNALKILEDLKTGK